jgi:hypothetical protein
LFVELDVIFGAGGDKVTIEVKSIDEDRCQLEFPLLEIGGSPIALRER